MVEGGATLLDADFLWEDGVEELLLVMGLLADADLWWTLG